MDYLYIQLHKWISDNYAESEENTYIWSHVIKCLENLNQSAMTGSRSVVAWGGKEERPKEERWQRSKQRLWGDGYVHYFGCNDGIIGACFCQNQSNCTC